MVLWRYLSSVIGLRGLEVGADSEEVGVEEAVDAVVVRRMLRQPVRRRVLRLEEVLNDDITSVLWDCLTTRALPARQHA